MHKVDPRPNNSIASKQIFFKPNRSPNQLLAGIEIASANKKAILIQSVAVIGI